MNAVDENRPEVDRLKAALSEYGDHKMGCLAWEMGTALCTCGFDTTRRKLLGE